MQSSFNTPTDGSAEVAVIEDELRDVVGESEALRDRLAALTHGCVPACSTNHHPSYHLSYSPPTHTQQYTEFLVFLASAVSANRHLRNLLTHLSLSPLLLLMLAQPVLTPWMTKSVLTRLRCCGWRHSKPRECGWWRRHHEHCVRQKSRVKQTAVLLKTRALSCAGH